MCAMCDGATYDEFLAGTHELIERFGFTVGGIEPDPDHPGWLHTIGLVDGIGHPELCMLGMPLGLGIAMLSRWASYVLEGHTLAEGETGCLGDVCYSDDEVAVAGDVIFHIRAVDERLWHGDMFDQWHEYYRWLGGPSPPPEGVELTLCGSQPDVFLPPRPNRAARRARARRRHRPWLVP